MPRNQQTDRLVIGIAGRIGAGKTSAAKYLNSRYGFQYLRYSLVLAEWRASDAENKLGLQEIGWDVMNGGSQEELNRRLIAKLSSDTSAAIDGLRHPIDYDSLRKCFLNSFHLFYIDSPRPLRWARLRDRERYRAQEAFEAADRHPVEQQIDALKPRAEKLLNNEGSLEELYALLDESIATIQSAGHT